MVLEEPYMSAVTAPMYCSKNTSALNLKHDSRKLRDFGSLVYRIVDRGRLMANGSTCVLADIFWRTLSQKIGIGGRGGAGSHTTLGWHLKTVMISRFRGLKPVTEPPWRKDKTHWSSSMCAASDILTFSAESPYTNACSYARLVRMSMAQRPSSLRKRVGSPTSKCCPAAMSGRITYVREVSSRGILLYALRQLGGLSWAP